MLDAIGHDSRSSIYWESEYKAEVEKNKAVRQQLDSTLQDVNNWRDIAQWADDAMDKLQTELLNTQAKLKRLKSELNPPSPPSYVEYILDAHAERLENLERRINNE